MHFIFSRKFSLFLYALFVFYFWKGFLGFIVLVIFLFADANAVSLFSPILQRTSIIFFYFTTTALCIRYAGES